MENEQEFDECFIEGLRKVAEGGRRKFQTILHVERKREHANKFSDEFMEMKKLINSRKWAANVALPSIPCYDAAFPAVSFQGVDVWVIPPTGKPIRPGILFLYAD